MAEVALFLYLLFIIIALRDDAKEGRQFSFELWIPCIWFSISASRSFTEWIYLSMPLEGVSESSYMDGSPIDRALLSIMLGAGIMILYKRKDRTSFSSHGNICLVLFYIYALLSVGWSDYMGSSIRRWIRMAGDLIMVLVILTEDDQQEAIERVLRRCAIFLIPLSVVVIRYYSNIGIAYGVDGSRMWTGVAMQKNSLGILCAFIGVYLFWRFINKWPEFSYLDGFLFLLALYLLHGSRSATSIVVFILGIILLVSAALLKSDLRNFNIMLIASSLFLLILQGILVSVFDTSIGSLFFTVTERDSSFTERMPVWLELIQIGSQRLVFGTGYGGVWINDPRLQNSHNGYIHVFMDMGIVGMMFLLLLIAQSYKNVMNAFGEKWGIGKLQLVFIVMILFHNITESTIARGTSSLWFLFLLSSVVVIKENDDSETGSHPVSETIPWPDGPSES